MAVSGRVVFWLVVAFVAFLLVRGYDGHAAPVTPAGCQQLDYGRDAYIDCR